MDTIHLSHTDSATQLARLAFPEYRGQRFRVCPTAGPVDLTSCWDEGRRDYHKIVRLADSHVVAVPENGNPYTGMLPANIPTLPAPGFAVVTHSLTGRGFDSVTIYVHPSNLNNLAMPAPVELEWAERVVLAATRSLKSSYAGISNYRLHEARGTTGITGAEWESAKSALIGRKLLNGAGALTVAGKNAIGRTQLYELKRAQASGMLAIA